MPTSDPISAAGGDRPSHPMRAMVVLLVGVTALILLLSLVAL